jgi:hypothetical protein
MAKRINRGLISGRVRFIGLPLPEFDQLSESAIRIAFEKLVVFWKKNIARMHFTGVAFRMYGGLEDRVYNKRSYKYEQRKQRQFGHTDPLVRTGRVREEFLRGSTMTRFAGAGRELRMVASWPALPRYVYQEANNRSPRKYAELTILNNEDREVLRRKFIQFFNSEIERAGQGGGAGSAREAFAA